MTSVTPTHLTQNTPFQELFDRCIPGSKARERHAAKVSGWSPAKRLKQWSQCPTADPSPERRSDFGECFLGIERFFLLEWEVFTLEGCLNCSITLQRTLRCHQINVSQLIEESSPAAFLSDAHDEPD